MGGRKRTREGEGVCEEGSEVRGEREDERERQGGRPLFVHRTSTRSSTVAQCPY
jgi:hypothetical protein